MNYKNILITGGAGFVGSNIAFNLKKQYPAVNITALDNLKRRGSELNIPRLKEQNINFVHGDIRNKEDFSELKDIDLIIECSAEPSVMAGVDSSPEYLLNTNLLGTINCLELARETQAHFIFLSTSRVYPMETIAELALTEEQTRFKLNDKQTIPGASADGIAENFPIEKARSLYGSTKLASELFVKEYIASYGIKGIINRCGVLTGPWQMGKIDQGVMVLWMAKHIFKQKLSYIGYGGLGKQVRDFLHVDDLFNLLNIQLKDIAKFNGHTYNVGGGLNNTVSLLELTQICEDISGNKIEIDSIEETRANDIPIYISDCSKIEKITGWKPQKNAETTMREIHKWIINNKGILQNIL